MPSRNYATDWMRIVAAFFVVMIHCADLGSVAGVVYNSLARFSVPVFVMISGYHMLNTPVKLGKIGKKVRNTFAILVLWSSIFYGYSLLMGRMAYINIQDTLTYLVTGPIHLWYLYAAIALYVLAPLFQVFHQNAVKSTYRYVLVILFVVGSLVKTIQSSGCAPLVSTIVSSMKLPITVGFLFLFLGGGYLRKYGLSGKERWFVYALGILGAVCTAVLTWHLKTQLFLSFFAPTVMLSGICFFAFSQKIFEEFKPRNPQLILLASKSSLGIYLFHPLLNMVLQDIGWAPFSTLPTLLSIPLTTAFVFLLSLTIVSSYYILKRSKESL